MIHYQNRWAVVTGASSGLGRGLAARLADRGMSVLLTGRRAIHFAIGEPENVDVSEIIARPTDER